MKKNESQFLLRDLLAMPFAIVAGVFLWLAVSIGGSWTAEEYAKAFNL